MKARQAVATVWTTLQEIKSLQQFKPHSLKPSSCSKSRLWQQLQGSQLKPSSADKSSTWQHYKTHSWNQAVQEISYSANSYKTHSLKPSSWRHKNLNNTKLTSWNQALKAGKLPATTAASCRSSDLNSSCKQECKAATLQQQLQDSQLKQATEDRSSYSATAVANLAS